MRYLYIIIGADNNFIIHFFIISFYVVLSVLLYCLPYKANKLHNNNNNWRPIAPLLLLDWVRHCVAERPTLLNLFTKFNNYFCESHKRPQQH